MNNCKITSITVSPGLDDLNPLIRRLERMLGEHRLLHSLGAYHTMLFLADSCGKNLYNAAILGLVHDCARGMTKDEMARELEKRTDFLPEEDWNCPKIWHARLGALIAKQDFGVKDSELLEAIRIHPTGAPDMSVSARMLFVADFIEPTRTFIGVEAFRELAFSDFERAFRKILETKLEIVRKKESVLHHDSERAANFYL